MTHGNVRSAKKEMVISGGMNVFPAEIEDVLRRHDAVRDVAVIGLPHERWGERIVGVVEADPDGPELVEEELIDLCRLNLASYKKPTQVVVVDEIPRTSSGKAKKFLLVEQLAKSGAPG